MNIQTKSFIFALFVFLFLNACSSIHSTRRDNQSIRPADKQLAGSWVAKIHIDGMDPDSLIMNCYYNKNGTAMVITEGKYLAGNVAATFKVIEAHTWYIDEGFLYTKSISQELTDLKGNPQSILNLKQQFKKLFPEEGIGTEAKYKILSMNKEECRLLLSLGKDKKGVMILKKKN